MRLTAEVVRSAPSYINPLKDRELSLRGLKIPTIENLGVTEDQFEAIDFSDNEIIKLENFPLLPRLTTLLLNNNRIAKISDGLSQFIPKLSNLMLTNNKLSKFEDVKALSQFKNLNNLSLVHNPVSKLTHYRLYVIYLLPRLKILDFTKIKPQEKKDATRRFASSSNKPTTNNLNNTDYINNNDIKEVESSHMDIEIDSQTNKARTQDRSQDRSSATIADLTPELRNKIMEKIQETKSIDEIDELEAILKSGKISSNYFI